MSQDNAPFVLVTTNDHFEQRLRAVLADSDTRLSRWDSVDAAPGFTLDGVWDGVEVLALGPGLPVELALDIAAKMDLERPEVSILLITYPTPRVWEHALRAGVRDVVAPTATNEELWEACQRGLSTARRRRENLVGESEPEAPTGSIITVLSPKGGSGKTTMSTNLAVGLAARAPNDVVIVDLDLQFGDVADALQLAPKASMVDVARAGFADAVALKVYLTPHPAGLFALCAPEQPGEGEEITAAQVAQVIKLLAAEFSYVIVDTSAGLDEHALAALELSTDLVCLCSMDVPSIRGLRKELVALDQLGMTTQRRHFVLNRADSKVGLDVADIEATVGLAVDVQVSSSRSVPLSLNQGTPVLQGQPRSPVGRQLDGLVDRFVRVPADAQASTPRGGFLRRRKDVT